MIDCSNQHTHGASQVLHQTLLFNLSVTCRPASALLTTICPVFVCCVAASVSINTAVLFFLAGPPVNSRLGAIVTAYLRQQHRAACLSAAQPVSVVPPVSLLKPYSLPVATRPLNAPANVTLRLARQEVWGGFGGRGASEGMTQLAVVLCVWCGSDAGCICFLRVS